MTAVMGCAITFHDRIGRDRLAAAVEPVIVEDALALLEAAVADTTRLGLNGQVCEVEVSLVADAEMTRLNFDHMGERGPTDVLSFPLADEDVAAALDGAVDGDVSEGCVGAGTGMQCFDLKGGIGTASRVLPAEDGAYTVGALVLTNFGSRPDLRIDGVRVGEQLTDLMPIDHHEGSCVVVVATDAPLLPHQLRRVAQRAGMGLARTGSTASNGSGEQMLAFSTANRISIKTADPVVDLRAVADARAGEPRLLGELFAATIEATEEAVVNALFAAETTVGRDGNTLYSMPPERVLPMMQRAGRLVPR